jgi:hypothetical protein
MHYFFALFNATVAAERQRRGTGFAEIAAKYAGVYRRALEMLGDPKLRIFAPVLAMFPDDVQVPPQLDAFIEQNRDKIQRAYALEAEHEW